MIRWACGESDKQAVGIEAVDGALKLVKYFQKTAIKVHDIICNPLDGLPTDKQTVYAALPNRFSTAQGVEIAQGYEMAERTAKRFFNEKALFEKKHWGEYEKIQ